MELKDCKTQAEVLIWCKNEWTGSEEQDLSNIFALAIAMTAKIARDEALEEAAEICDKKGDWYDEGIKINKGKPFLHLWIESQSLSRTLAIIIRQLKANHNA